MSAPLKSSVALPAPSAGIRKSLLVIDDDATHRAIICRVADRSGFAAVAAATVEDAELLLGSHQFDCLTLDLALGSRHGRDVLEAVAEFGRRIPIVIISGTDRECRRETERIARSLGLSVCTPLPKPIDPLLLRSKLATIHDRVSVGLCGCCDEDCGLRAKRAPETDAAVPVSI